MRNLILTGGIRHDFAASTQALIDLLSASGIESEQTGDIDRGIERLAAESFDLVTVMALRWRMLDNPRYADLRDEFGYSMPEECRRILLDFVEGGGGLLGLHTACLCFDDWPDWGRLLGGNWVWGQSFHPPLGLVDVSFTARPHCLTAGLPEFTVNDEVYAGLDMAADIEPLATARAGDGTEAPALWARVVDRGRVVFDALGHDRTSLQHPVHGRLLQRCAAWAGGISDKAVTAI